MAGWIRALTRFRRELQYGGRALRHAPAFTAAALTPRFASRANCVAVRL